MEKSNKLYKNIGIHVINSIFTVEKGNVKVLLVKRTNEPYKGMWALPSGALYNNELLESGSLRELNEKTGINNIDLIYSDIFDRIDRSEIMRMIGVSYIGVIDTKKALLNKETSKTSNADWFLINEIPSLAYDHNEIIKSTLNNLKSLILGTNILKGFFPNEFTIPELQKVYEAILNKKFDRRNFRKKLINLDLIKDTNKEVKFEGKRPAKLYKFNERIKNKNILLKYIFK